MRLIDADALETAIDKERQILIEQERFGAEHIVVHHARRLIEEAPIVDAIPVEWIQKYTVVGVTPRGDRLTEGNERLIVHRILNDWQKEQEAR